MTQPACIRLTDRDNERAGYVCVVCGANEETGTEPANDEVRAVFWRALQHQAVHDPVATNTTLGVELYDGDAVRPDVDGIVLLRHGLDSDSVYAVAFAADGSSRAVKGTASYGNDEVEVLATPDTVRVFLALTPDALSGVAPNT